MTKFGDKLKRLHNSRIRSTEATPKNTGVFLADAELAQDNGERESSPSSVSTKISRLRRSEKLRKIGTEQKGEKTRSETLRKKTHARKPITSESSAPISPNLNDEMIDETPHTAEFTFSNANDLPMADRLKDLRIQAAALINAGRVETSLKLLFEILAFAPHHAFALSKLSDYFKKTGDLQAARIFQERLEKITRY